MAETYYTHRPMSSAQTHHCSWQEAKQHACEQDQRGIRTLAKRKYVHENGRASMASWDPRFPERESHHHTDASQYWSVYLN